MTVTSVDKDLENLTLTLVADFAAPAESVWELWANPRQLERWWGPPTYPATFEQHDLSPGGEMRYFMTGPEGDKHHGYWVVESVEPPRALRVKDGFTDPDGNPTDGFSVTAMEMTLSDHEGGTRMELRSSFFSREGMEKMLEMGMEQGLGEAVGQMDALLAE
ncbi:MAG TPA: SRPBCC domain-containing protein [Solirubrobacterales bacterium]|nr:SRPBCC domain-containing protein [Solirubrobacterales bacterium]